MRAADVKKLYARDQNQCLHCGTTENLTVQHRANRGMGGSKNRDQASNLIVLCWFVNFEMEASSIKAKIAKEYGWKLESWESPAMVEVWSEPLRRWILLNDDWTYTIVE